MRFLKTTFTLLLTGLLITTVAQDLPQVSPSGKIEQKVGLTNISIEYSRPSVRDRKIFGGLVPFGEVWRLGANACTKITTDQYLKFGDQVLKPGTYAIFAIPGEKQWKVVFNKNIEQWGANEYDPKLDVVTLEVPAEACDFTETLEIEIEDLTMNSGTLAIHWAETQVEMPFKVNTKEIAAKNIQEAISKGEDLSTVYYNAARYYLSISETGQAEEYIVQSIKIESTFKNLFVLAKIQAEKGDKEEALKTAEKALNVATDKGEEGWASYINETIEAWKKG